MSVVQPAEIIDFSHASGLIRKFLIFPMKFYIKSIQTAKVTRYFLGLAVLALAFSTTAKATLLVYEGFNYAGQADNSPLGNAFNGGTGLSGNWMGTGKYRIGGLTFSDLFVSGGCAQSGNSDTYYRPLGVSKTGTIWGSFLFKSVGNVDSSDTLLSYIVSKQANGSDYNDNTSFGVTPKAYQNTLGDIRLGGNTITPTTLTNSGGMAVSQGVTYLVLFKVQNLVVSGGTSTSQIITSWILNDAQYNNFKSGGLTEDELNAANQGGGATEVMQRTNLPSSQKASFSMNDFLTIQSNNSGAFINDEFRFSDASLAEVAPLLPPAADIYAFGPAATVGPVAANTAAISWTVPFGTNVTNLAPTYTLSNGATCVPTSGSIQNFSSPVHYIVKASDFATSGKTTDYTATVTVAPASAACDILTFGLPSSAGVIDQVAKTISFTVPGNASVGSLSPVYTLSPSATCSPLPGTTLNFTNPQSYTVTAQNGTTQKTYTVKAQTYQAWTHSASLFILTDADGANIPTGITEANFPLLVRLNKDSLNFDQVKTGGADIRFASKTGEPLAYEIEQWDPVAKIGAIWVRIPTISGNTKQEIKMYWGKSDAVSESSGPAVFNESNGYCAVMHMNGNVVDSTGFNTLASNGTKTSTAVIGNTAMNLANGSISANNINNFPIGINPISTGEIWFRARDISGGWCMPLAWSNTGAYGWGTWVMQIGFWGGEAKILPTPLTCHGPGETKGSTDIAAEQWYHVAYTNLNGVSTIYVNGVLDATTTSGYQDIKNPQAMSLGGGDIDVDETRISKVARSANWVKMEYENQKPLQTLVGNLVQAGTTFATTPQSVTLNELTSTTLTGQADGAQKVYWIEKRNGVDTTLSTNEYTLPVTCGRVTGTQNYIIQFKAIYATSTQIINVPITCVDTIPDPEFFLTGPSTWNGRDPAEYKPTIINMADLQAQEVSNVKYTWTVNGVAVSKQITPGVLKLTQAQGDGEMKVTLMMENGGKQFSQTKIVTVQQPIDERVQRIPGANEKPVNKQFYARDFLGANKDYGTIYYNGTEPNQIGKVYLKVYKKVGSAPETSETYTKDLINGAYSFAVQIEGGKFTYRVEYGKLNGAGQEEPPSASVTDLICGDAYIIEGQSNALAIDNSVATDSSDPWIRTYGKTVGWGDAVNKGSEMQIGVWGFIFAKRLSLNQNMPICIINGAVGGTRIDRHRPNPVDHSLEFNPDTNIYANLYNRVVAAKLTHGIRAVLWHQGEQDQGSAGIDGDFNYKFYQQYFIDISSAWKHDFPNILNYYVFQIWPAACGENSRNDQLREVQRSLSSLYSNMRLMSTLGINPGSSCHYELGGYQVFSDLIGPLVEQDSYSTNPNSVFSAANLKKAYFTSATHSEINLVFDQDMQWNTGAPSMIYLDDVAGKVTSGSASGKVVTLQLNAASSAKKITYVKGLVYFEQNYLLKGTNGRAALTFADVDIEASALTSQTISFGSLQTKKTGMGRSRSVLRQVQDF